MKSPIKKLEIINKKETPFFFDNEESRLFSILHVPDPLHLDKKSLTQKGIVFCHPFAEEKGISHRVMVEFARFMCKKGYYILRFDCRGYGDSEGDSEQVTLEGQLSDIRRATEVLGELAGIDKPVLFGLRFGGTLAALAAERDVGLKALVLWEPVIKVKAHLLQFLRMLVVAEKLKDKKSQRTRNDYLEELRKGKAVDIFGFMLSSDFFNQCSLLDVIDQKKEYHQPMLVVGMSALDSYKQELNIFMNSYLASNNDNQLIYLAEKKFWLDPNNVFRELHSWYGHEKLFQTTLDWLEKLY